MIAVDARRALLGGLIDHAPMFPPAELPLDQALADHAAARMSDEAWMVNRFVVRASRLAELPTDDPPRLSVVVDVDPPADPRIESYETTDDHWAPRSGELYVEHPVGPLFDGWLPNLVGSRAKIRCGPTPPEIADLAAAIRSCRRQGVAFKATAGLHHAVRAGAQHGFLNLLAAAIFGDDERALAETEPSAFSLDGETFRWHDREATAEEIAAARRNLFVSFGSCSFTEPVDELRALGFL